MLNIIQQHICLSIIDVIKKAGTKLTANEVKERLDFEIDDMDLSAFLSILTEQGMLKQGRVLNSRGNFTAWSICDD